MKSFSRLHDILTSHPFDAVIVDEAFLALRCIIPLKHLWEVRSPVTIIRYSVKGASTVTAEAFSIPDSVSGIKGKPDRPEKVQSILAALCSTVTEEVGEKAVEYRANNQPVRLSLSPEEGFPLHRKMKTILDLLENRGNQGVSTKEISDAVWGETNRDRTKDIQIYICKLRRVVARADGRYAIRLENGRYSLRDLS